MKHTERVVPYWECSKGDGHIIAEPGFADCPVVEKKQTTRCGGELVKREFTLSHRECPKCGHHQ